MGLTGVAPTAHADSPRQLREAALRGVSREVRVLIDLGSRPAFEPTARLMPGARAVEAFLPTDEATLEKALHRYPSSMNVEFEPIEYGLRVRFSHPSDDLLWSMHRSGSHLLLLFGPESESHRLRSLADALRGPIPSPDDLGAQLELWHEAEKATQAGELNLALKLWDKLAEDPSLRDLARLRSAELFVISGHVEEALFQLREVSRDHPRSTGAALARLTALHLEAITGESDPNPAQVVIAAGSGSRHRYHDFTWLRAAAVLREIDRCDLALHHSPRPEQLPRPFDDAARESQRLLAEASLGRRAALGDHVGVVVRFEAWDRVIADHPRRAQLRALAAESYAALGLHQRSVPLLRAELTGADEGTAPARGLHEARIIDTLARAYAARDELDHLRTVVTYQLEHHPDAPGVADRMRELVFAEWRTAGEDSRAAWSRAQALYDAAPNKRLRGSALAIAVDLAEAWGTDEQLVYALERFEKLGFDDPARRGPQLAVALARVGRHGEAEPRLRAVIARTTDPELRDEMAYLLAEVDAATERDADADAILRALATHETRWGRVARARLRERALHDVVEALEQRNAAALNASTTPSPRQG